MRYGEGCDTDPCRPRGHPLGPPPAAVCTTRSELRPAYRDRALAATPVGLLSRYLVGVSKYTRVNGKYVCSLCIGRIIYVCYTISNDVTPWNKY